MKIHTDAYRDIIEAYTIELWTLQECADVLHVSRTAVKRFLNKNGIDTSNKRIQVSCTTCGNTLERTRKRIKTQRNHFCSTDCYSSFLSVGKSIYVQNRHSQRMARRIVAKLFQLEPEYIVHHEDRNNYNNHPSNLKVFANQGDHLRYHHLKRDEYANKLTNKKSNYRKAWEEYHEFEIKPLWSGKEFVDHTKDLERSAKKYPL